MPLAARTRQGREMRRVGVPDSSGIVRWGGPPDGQPREAVLKLVYLLDEHAISLFQTMSQRPA